MTAILKAEAAREAAFSKFDTNKTLLTSFMSGRGGTGGSGGGGDVEMEDAEADFLNVLNIPAFGDFKRMWVDMYFGEVSDRSKRCEMAIDTGKRVMNSMYPLLELNSLL